MSLTSRPCATSEAAEFWLTSWCAAAPDLHSHREVTCRRSVREPALRGEQGARHRHTPTSALLLALVTVMNEGLPAA
jgi:hypothetical protein